MADHFLERKAELLCFLTLSEIFAFRLTGAELRVDHLVENPSALITTTASITDASFVLPTNAERTIAPKRIRIRMLLN